MVNVSCLISVNLSLENIIDFSLPENRKKLLHADKFFILMQTNKHCKYMYGTIYTTNICTLSQVTGRFVTFETVFNKTTPNFYLSTKYN